MIDSAGFSMRNMVVQQSHPSTFLMSEPGATRVNVTNPFTDTRHHGYVNQSHFAHAQPFDQHQDNSFTYTLQQPYPLQSELYAHQFVQGHQPYYEDYDEEDSSSSSSDERLSDNSSLSEYTPSEQVKNYFHHQQELYHQQAMPLKQSIHKQSIHPHNRHVGNHQQSMNFGKTVKHSSTAKYNNMHYNPADPMDECSSSSDMY